MRNAQLTRRPESAVLWVTSVLAVLLLASNYISTISDREASAQFATQHFVAPSLALSSPSLPAVAAPSQPAASTTVGQVLPAVVAAVNALPHQRGIPASLHPPVGALLSDIAQIPSACEAHDGQTSESICRFGASAGRRRIVIVGDSHAEMWLPALLRSAQADGAAVLPVLKSGCTPGLWTASLGPADCHGWFAWAMRTAASLHPTVILIAGLYSGSGAVQATLSGLDAAVRAQKKTSARVMLLGDVPERNAQPVDCLLGRNASLARCSDSLTVSEAQVSSQVAQLASTDGVRFIDPTGWFCYDGVCPLVIDGIIAYRDEGHISQTYSAALGQALWGAITAR